MQTIDALSPAKINLFLDILQKRADGYHDIVTVFEKINLCDRIRITPLGKKGPAGISNSGGIEISSNVKELPTGEENLVYRACSLLKKKCAVSEAVKIHIEKDIPIAAGLGGGSGNAALTLKCLNRLWGLGLTEEILAGMAREIGADVPFFICDRPFALGKGRGDDITPIEGGPRMWHVVISAPARLLAGDIYGEANLNLTGGGPDVRIMLRAIERRDSEGIKKCLYNGLEPVVAKKVTHISGVKNFLKKMGFEAAMVSGSGPAIFVLTRSRKEAETLREDFLRLFASRMPSPGGWKVFIAETFTEHTPDI